MNQTHLLEIMVKLFIIIALIRAATMLLPGYLLIIVAILLIFASGVLDPQLIKTIQQSSTPLVSLLLPFFFLLLAFSIVAKGLTKKK